MDDRTAAQLVELNRDFYVSFAQPFIETRSDPQPGFAKLAERLPPFRQTVLDVGCGEGRFGRFLRASGLDIHYTGIDLTPELLAHARSEASDVLLARDISRPGALLGLPQFTCIVCLSTLQHIPDHGNRVRLLREMRAHLAPDGLIFLANWQFLDSPRQRRKLRDWSLVGIDFTSVGPQDYLLSWNRGGSGLRYVAYLDGAQTTALLDEAGLRLIEAFRSDGREGNLNLYSIVSS